MKSRRRAKGFTLMEIVMAMMVFAVAVVSLAGVFLGIFSLGESGRNLTQALNDARAVMEGIRETSASGLSTVTSTNWTTWAQAQGLTSLRNEAITVTYTNPSTDPLPVTVQVSWQERGQNRSATVDTLVTRR